MENQLYMQPGSIEKIGQSDKTSYIFYTANNGDLYFINIPDEIGEAHLDLMKYELQTGLITTIKENFTDYLDGNNDGFGMIAPTRDGEKVYCMTSYGAQAEIWRLKCSDDSFEHITNICSENNCGSNQWKLKNLTLSQDDNTLFFISISNNDDEKRVFMIDLESESPVCTEVLNINDITGPERSLCYSGINVWDKYSNFYTPVWSYDYDDNDLALLKVHVPIGSGDQYSAELLHFTDNGKEDGNPLFPEFRHHSCWNGIGAASNGCIYIAVSNHYKPLNSSDIHGNVAIYKYDPEELKMSFLGDIKSVSSAVNNWMPDESQNKVHTFIREHADGNLYFASNDAEPSYFLRGAHLYTIDPTDDTINDFSKTQPLVMLRDFSVVPNEQTPSSTSGVFIEYYAIKGLSLNPRVPKLMYFMLYAADEPGYILKYLLP